MNNFLTSLFISFFVVSVYGMADECFVQGGYKYHISSNGTVSIADIGRDISLPISADSTLIIPSSVEYEGKFYLVNQIAQAFACHQEIKHLVISKGVEIINPNAFTRCINLESIYVPSTIRMMGESGRIFRGCCNLSRITVDEQNEVFDSRNDCNAIIDTKKNTLVLGCHSTEIPSTVTTIGIEAFGYCEKMESIYIPEGVKRIEALAFKNCLNLKEVSLPNSLDSLGSSVFDGCMALGSITIPRNVTKISSRVFAGCLNLKEVNVDKKNRTFDSRNKCNAIIDSAQDTIVAGCGASIILDGIKAIGSMAFYRSSIRDIKIPASIYHIGTQAFAACKFCYRISVDSLNPVYNSEANSNAIIETASGTLLQGCMNTIVPNNVKAIGDYAFIQVQMPSYLVIGEGVRVIGESAFAHCLGLENVQMPSTLKQIKHGAFQNCNLYYVDMSRCNTEIGPLAFCDCSNLYTVNLSHVHGKIAHSAFWNAPCEAWVKKFIGRN